MGSLRRSAAAGAAALLLPGVAVAAEAITTPGSGTLTMCRDWLVYESCTRYHKVELPPRIAVGDRVDVTYGSNPKDYTFHVIEIRHEGDDCILLSARSGSGGKGEKIEVTPCAAAAAAP